MSLSLLQTIPEVRQAIASSRAEGNSIGVVPTMGALHEGHGTLISTARAECGYVVVTLFVNPTQFDRAEDLDRYPRSLDEDLAYIESLGGDAVFAPSVQEMYPGKPLTVVEVAEMSSRVEGHYRPGHFKGVSTVVAKLLNIVQADRAYFGEKDAQQLAVIQKMVADLNIPVSIIPVPTVREADGLALSSRNRLLTDEDRVIAPVLHQALEAAAQVIRKGAYTPAAARSAAMEVLAGAPQMKLEYLEFVDPASFTPLDRLHGKVRIVTAAWLGKVRLIDNVLCEVSTKLAR